MLGPKQPVPERARRYFRSLTPLKEESKHESLLDGAEKPVSCSKNLRDEVREREGLSLAASMRLRKNTYIFCLLLSIDANSLSL